MWPTTATILKLCATICLTASVTAAILYLFERIVSAREDEVWGPPKCSKQRKDASDAKGRDLRRKSARGSRR